MSARLRDNISIVTTGCLGDIREKGLQRKLTRNDRWEKGPGEAIRALHGRGIAVAI